YDAIARGEMAELFSKDAIDERIEKVRNGELEFGGSGVARGTSSTNTSSQKQKLADLERQLETIQEEIASIPAWEKTRALGAPGSARYNAALAEQHRIERDIAEITGKPSYAKSLEIFGQTLAAFMGLGLMGCSKPPSQSAEDTLTIGTPQPNQTAVPTPYSTAPPSPIANATPPFQHEFKVSNEIKEMIKEQEGSDSYLRRHDIGAFDESGNLIGIYPHYVGDGGITLGYGHYVASREASPDNKDFSQSEYDLLYTYIPQSAALNGPAGTKVPDSDYVPIDIVIGILDDDVANVEYKLSRDLNVNGIEVDDRWFDALAFIYFKTDAIGEKTQAYLQSGSRDPEGLREIWEETDRRRNRAYLYLFGD
ncbi:hypothetical protein LJC42_08920, partial [Eubacteriales bacterium OttesenSCG-928-K08]|nr:hypothetical protein [Eubacteriales bacterium OttesenSCG-928-K08]